MNSLSTKTLGFLIAVVWCGFGLAAGKNLNQLEQELQRLEQELPSVLAEGTELEARQDFINRVLALREEIESLKDSSAENQNRSRTYKLVEVEGYQYPGEDYRFDESSITLSYFRGGPDYDEKAAVSIGLESYPKSIVLGEDFSFVASMRSQREVKPERCSRTSSNRYVLFEKNVIKLGSKQVAASKRHDFIRPGCEESSSNGQTNWSKGFSAGHQLQVGVNCRFYETRKSVYLEYRYQCEPTAINGEIADNFYFNARTAIELSWSVEKGANGEWITQSDFANRHELRVTVGGATIPSNAISLLYQADYKNDLEQQGGGTAQHPVVVRNTWEGVGQTETPSIAQEIEDSPDGHEAPPGSSCITLTKGDKYGPHNGRTRCCDEKGGSRWWGPHYGNKYAESGKYYKNSCNSWLGITDTDKKTLPLSTGQCFALSSGDKYGPHNGRTRCCNEGSGSRWWGAHYGEEYSSSGKLYSGTCESWLGN